MDLFQNKLLSQYEDLVKLSLLAQEKHDFEENDRITDLLDVLWVELSAEERAATEFINNRLVVWSELQAKVVNPSISFVLSTTFVRVKYPLKRTVGHWSDAELRSAPIKSQDFELAAA
jgi:hypothetical protein